jgi:hypothetical protein
MLLPAEIVTGSVRPLNENCDVLTPTDEMVTAVLPALSVPVWLCVVPATMLPKLMTDGVSVNWPGRVPVPERGTETPELALSVTAKLPVVLVPVDAKATVNVTLWPAVRVNGGAIPLTLNAAALEVSCETVKDDPPELVSVSDRVAVVPAGTLPKLRLAGLEARWPGVVPVPERGRLTEGLDAFDVRVRLPLVVAADVGENATLKLTLWPGFKVAGRLSPVVLKLEVAPAAEIVTLVPPELVSVSGNV